MTPLISLGGGAAGRFRASDNVPRHGGGIVPDMTDRRTDEATQTRSALRVRIVGTVASWLVVAPALPVYMYMLWWFSPEITSPGWCDQGSTWWRSYDGAVMWVVACVAIVAGALCFCVGTSRLRRSERWWPWPVAAVASVAAGWPAMTGISSAAWCPMS